MHDKEKALHEAKQLLTETLNPAKPVFNMGVTQATDTARDTDADYDHMFRSEVLFGLYTLNRQNLYNTYFSPEIEQAARRSFNSYNADEQRLGALYDDGNDYRKKAWIPLRNATGTFLTHVKFAVAPYNPSPNMMPLIRMAEIILMAAECSSTLDEGKAYLNMLRTSKFCVDLNPTSTAQLKEFITNEFRKETIGEGQMFFYYKRNAMTTVPNHLWSDVQPVPNKTISLANYVVPLPESEVAIRTN
jgi:hypothetical protein